MGSCCGVAKGHGHQSDKKPWEAQRTQVPGLSRLHHYSPQPSQLPDPISASTSARVMDYSNYANQQSQPYSLYGLPTPDQQPQPHNDDALRDPFSLVRLPFLRNTKLGDSPKLAGLLTIPTRIPTTSTSPASTLLSTPTPRPLSRHRIRPQTPSPSTRFLAMI